MQECYAILLSVYYVSLLFKEVTNTLVHIIGSLDREICKHFHQNDGRQGEDAPRQSVKRHSTEQYYTEIHKCHHVILTN
jgi:hypothetical protein